MSTEARQHLTILGVSFTLPDWMTSSQFRAPEAAPSTIVFDSDDLDEEFDDDVLYDHFPRP